MKTHWSEWFTPIWKSRIWLATEMQLVFSYRSKSRSGSETVNLVTIWDDLKTLPRCSSTQMTVVTLNQYKDDYIIQLSDRMFSSLRVDAWFSIFNDRIWFRTILTKIVFNIMYCQPTFVPRLLYKLFNRKIALWLYLVCFKCTIKQLMYWIETKRRVHRVCAIIYIFRRFR